MVFQAIPMYPKPNDLVLLIDTIVDVAGTYSRGILFRFGTQLGDRYGKAIIKEGMVHEDVMKPILGMLQASGWFEDNTMDWDGNRMEIKILKPFEEESKQKGCDFLRGFLAGIGTVFKDLPQFYQETKSNGWTSFVGEMEGDT